MRLLTSLPVLVLTLGACKGDDPTEPVGRFSAMGALTVDESALLMVGGATSTASDGPLREAWRYDLDSDAWTALAEPPDETLRGVASTHEGELWVYGGSTTGWTDHSWLWKWDDNSDTWEEQGEGGPEARFKHAAGVANETLVMTGGRNNDGAEEVVYGDTWLLDLDDGVWEELVTTGGPSGIHRHGMSWDADRGVFWIHGGFQPPAGETDGELERSDRLWGLSLVTREWTEHTWTGDGPPVRASHAVELLASGELMVWGGNASDTSTWTYDPDAAEWTEHSHDSAPLARDAFVGGLTSAGTYWMVGGDPVSEEVPDFVMDVWRLDTASMSWTEVRGVE